MPPLGRLLTVTGEFRVLASLMPPSVVSALMLVAANFKAVVLPMPVAASRSAVLAVINPAPSMAPAESMCTVSPVAVVVPVSTMSPEPVVVRVMAPSLVVTVLKVTAPPPL